LNLFGPIAALPASAKARRSRHDSVTGAAGTVGREVVDQLLAAGQGVRGLTRDRVRANFDERVEVVAADLNKPETLAKAVEGVERVFSLALGPQGALQEENLAQAAKRAEVRHIVKLSALRAGGEARSGVASWHLAGEQAIQKSVIPWTFVQPGAFMSNALFWSASIKSQGKIFSNCGEGTLPYIHPRDIAAVAVRALTEPDHEGRAYPLSGPEAIGIGTMAQILSDTIGKPIEYVPITDETAREGMQRSGMPPVLIDALLPFGAFVRNGRGAELFDTVEEVTGRRPLTFAEWAREHAGAFR
jgi:(4-alkanoyl-5-oxo-2,5-dihydrofuran-3-yl)methyl phosphate reductase